MIAIGLVFGMAFGFLLAAGGLTDYDTVHDSLLFRDAYVFLVMGSAVLTAMPLLYLLKRRRWVTPLGGPLTITPSRIESKFVRGGLVFGVGFGISGTCAAPAVAMIGTGHLAGIATVAGLFAGIAVRDAYVARASATPGDQSHAPAPPAASPEVPAGTVIGL
jgi:uncharacterized membrane protein YedE/YeeE